MINTPDWAWAVPLIVASLALFGVAVTIGIQWRNFNRQLRSAHALKIAEMRQDWINELRKAMATFQSYGVTPGLQHHECREWYEAGTKIELFMNPADPDFPELRNCLYAFLGINDVDEKYAANPRYIDICQRVLKREWEVLKRDVIEAGGQKDSEFLRHWREIQSDVRGGRALS